MLDVIFLSDYFVHIISGFLMRVLWKIKGNLVNKIIKRWTDEG